MDLKQIGVALQVADKAGPELKKLKTVAQNIEGIFLKDLIAQMRKSVKQVKIGQSSGGEIYQDMMDQAFADAGSKSGNFGIGKILYTKFSKEVMAEAATAAARKATEAAIKPQD
jgi:Rod binding domain-containing protein